MSRTSRPKKKKKLTPEQQQEQQQKYNITNNNNLAITADDQSTMILLQKIYNNTNSETIRQNLRTSILNYLKESKETIEKISNKINLSLHTIYAITRTDKKNKPEFLTTLIICDYININILDVLKNHE
jgi:hypothetical protein